MSPSNTSLRRVSVVVAVLAIVVAIAVVGFWPSDATGSESNPVGHNASDRIAALDGMSATVKTVIERGGETNRSVQRVQMRPGTGAVRAETLSGTGPDVVVSNGTTRWEYDADAGLVRRTNATTLRSRMVTRGDRIERLFERVNVSGETEKTARKPPSAGVSPLPVVPYSNASSAQTPAASADSEEAFSVAYNGTATVAGRDVYVLQVQPENTTRYADFEQTLWVDTQWFVPLQYRTSWTEAGDPVELTVRYENVSMNPGLDDETFRFETPDDAAVVYPRLGENATERLESIDGLSATQRTEVDGLSLPSYNDTNVSENATGLPENGSYDTVSRIKVRPGTGKQRVEMIKEAEYGSSVIVSNGSVTWLYDREENNVTKIEGNSLGTFQRRGTQIERLFARLNRTRSTPDDDESGVPTPGVSVAPSTPASSGLSPPPSDEPGTDRFGVQLNGTELIDGRPAYVLEIRPQGNGTGARRNYSQTMWVDAEILYPIQERTTFGMNNDTVVSTTRLTNITINPGLENETFEFEPPENATISDSSTSFGDSYETRSETAANSELPTPDPAVPESFEFDQGRVSEYESVTSVTLTYANETSTLRVNVIKFNSSFSSNVSANASNASTNVSQYGQQVQIGDRNATFTQSGLYGSINWDCGELGYSVSGQFVSKPLLVDVARSIECPE